MNTLERRRNISGPVPPDWHDGVLAEKYVREHAGSMVAVDYYVALERKRWGRMSVARFLLERAKYRRWESWHKQRSQ